MKKILLTALMSFPIAAWETPISNEDIPRNPRVAVYIPAQIGSPLLSQKLLKTIDGLTVIERTYQRAKFIRRANRVCVVTDSSEIASLIGEDALLINKEYAKGTERICDALSYENAKEDIIVNVHGDEPYLKPELLDFAIQKFLECEADPSVGAVFLHYELSAEEAALPSRIKVVIDQKDNLLYGSRSVIPYGKSPRYFGRMRFMVYRADALKKFWQHSNTPLQTAENLDWIKLLEMGYTIKSFEISNPVERNVKEPDDLAMLSEKYSKPRIYLIRSGGFSSYFVDKTNALWPLREGDLVCRCKRTNFNNLDLFNGRVDYAFFRLEKGFVDPNTLISKTFTGKPSDTSIAVLDDIRKGQGFERVESLVEKFCKANNFQHGEAIDVDLLAADFKAKTGCLYNREKSGHKPSLGFVAISYLRRHFPNHLIVLVDFTFEGAIAHQWEREEQYALRLEREGHLIRLLEKVQEGPLIRIEQEKINRKITKNK